MSKLDDLIKEYCPNGVEYKTIEDITIRLKGMNITAEQMKKLAYSGGDILVFGGGNTVVNIRKQDLDHNKIIYIPSILCQSRGIVDFKYITQPYTFKNEMWAYIPKEDNLSIKFLYFFLKSKVPVLREESNKMGAMPQICISKINEMIQIPIPPLEVQEYIVSILEPMEGYIAELTAELTARKTQYEGMLSKVMSKIPIPPLEVQEYIVSILEPMEGYIAELTAELTARKTQYEGMLSKVMSKAPETKKMSEIITSHSKGTGITKKQLTEEGVPCLRYSK